MTARMTDQEVWLILAEQWGTPVNVDAGLGPLGSGGLCATLKRVLNRTGPQWYRRYKRMAKSIGLFDPCADATEERFGFTYYWLPSGEHRDERAMAALLLAAGARW